MLSTAIFKTGNGESGNRNGEWERGMGTGNGNGEWERGMGTGNGEWERESGGCKIANQGGVKRGIRWCKTGNQMV